MLCRCVIFQDFFFILLNPIFGICQDMSEKLICTPRRERKESVACEGAQMAPCLSAPGLITGPISPSKPITPIAPLETCPFPGKPQPHGLKATPSIMVHLESTLQTGKGITARGVGTYACGVGTMQTWSVHSPVHVLHLLSIICLSSIKLYLFSSVTSALFCV